MRVPSVLPPPLVSAIPSIRWPLGPTSSPPLYLETLESLKSIRNKNPPVLDLLQDLPSTIDTLFPPSTITEDAEKRHYGLVSTALILLGNGFTDECHNLVTPLSWPDDIHFAHGPSVYSQVSAEARAYATYVHCLVHRREGFHTGEFGMVGFANANFWSNAVAKSAGGLPHEALLRHIRTLVDSEPEESLGRDWAYRHYLNDDDDDDGEVPFFESRAVHELCATVMRGGQNEEHQQFAEQVAETELRVLLGHALQKAGFDVSLESIMRRRDDVDDSPTEPSTEAAAAPHDYEIDESVALTAGKKASSAHLTNFQASGSIVLRQVNGDALSAAAGIACRLMSSPACRMLDSATTAHDGEVLQIALPTSHEEAETINELIGAGGSLSPGDLIARVTTERMQVGSVWFNFVPCDKADPSALFVDRLFGTRGETPTTVVQWSKGTIF